MGISMDNWLVVDLPLWKIWKSMGWLFPIYEKKHVPNHQSNFKHGVMCLAVLPPGSPQRQREACACPVPVAFQRASAHPLDEYPDLWWAAYAIFSSIFPKKMLGQFTSIPILLSNKYCTLKKDVLFFEWSHPDPLSWHSFWHKIWKYICMAHIFWHSIWQYLAFWHKISDILFGIYSDIPDKKKNNNSHLTGVEKHPSRKPGASPETPSLSCPTSQPSRQRDPLHPGDVENLIQNAVLWPKKGISRFDRILECINVYKLYIYI